MKKCKYCQSEIDSKAKICPNCQKKQKVNGLKVVLIIILLVIIISSIAAAGSNTASEGDLSDTKSNETKEKFTYEILKQYSDDYGMGYYIEGNVRNNQDIDYSYVQIEFICYDANGTNLGTAIDNTNNLLGNQTWKFKAMAMFSDAKTVDNCDYHDISAY